MKSYIVCWHTIDRDGEVCKTGYSIVEDASNSKNAQQLFRKRVLIPHGERLRIELVEAR